MAGASPSTRAARLEAAVARAVAAAPPLSDRTITRLSVLLGPTRLARPEDHEQPRTADQPAA